MPWGDIDLHTYPTRPVTRVSRRVAKISPPFFVRLDCGRPNRLPPRVCALRNPDRKRTSLRVAKTFLTNAGIQNLRKPVYQRLFGCNRNFSRGEPADAQREMLRIAAPQQAAGLGGRKARKVKRQQVQANSRKGNSGDSIVRIALPALILFACIPSLLLLILLPSPDASPTASAAFEPSTRSRFAAAWGARRRTWNGTSRGVPGSCGSYDSPSTHWERLREGSSPTWIWPESLGPGLSVHACSVP